MLCSLVATVRFSFSPSCCTGSGPGHRPKSSMRSLRAICYPCAQTGEVRRVFGPQVIVPGNHSTKAGNLSMSVNSTQSDVSVTIHTTLYSQEAHLLKAALSKYDVLTPYSQRPWHALKHPISSKLPTAQKKSWCSAISNTSRYTDAALSVLLSH